MPDEIRLTPAPLLVWRVRPPLVRLKGASWEAERIEAVQLEILDRNGAVDTDAHVYAATAGVLDAGDRWRAALRPGVVSWYAATDSGKLPVQGRKLYLGGRFGRKKAARWRTARWRLLRRGATTRGPYKQPVKPRGALILKDPAQRAFSVPVTLAALGPGHACASDPRDGRGIVCPVGFAVTLVLSSGHDDRDKPYAARAALRLDPKGSDPTGFGIQTESAALPGSWHVRWKGLDGTLDANSRVCIRLETPADKSLVLRSFYLVACTRPNEAADKGELTAPTRITFVSSLEDFDGDGLANAEDPRPFGRP